MNFLARLNDVEEIVRLIKVSETRPTKVSDNSPCSYMRRGEETDLWLGLLIASSFLFAFLLLTQQFKKRRMKTTRMCTW